MKEKNPDLLDYLTWRGDLTFRQSPFNEIDAAILSQLSYLNLSDILSDSFKDKKSIYLVNELFRSHKEFKNRCFIGQMINPKAVDLLNACAHSERFDEVIVSGYKQIIDYEKVEQFGALSFSFGKHTCIVFEGTDDSFLGWKEDCYMALNEPIASHSSAMEYFEQAAKVNHGDFILIGHSKGGNVALKLAASCSKKLQKRIFAVYDFDGPGFPPAFFRTEGFKEIEPKLKTYYPQFSLVGMIFDQQKDYHIVKSSDPGPMQHDPFTWYVLGTKFIYEQDFTKESKFWKETVNDWAAKMSSDEKRKVFDTLFDVAWTGEAKTFTELNNNKLKCANLIFSAYTKLSKEEKQNLFDFVNIIKDVAKANLPLLEIFGTGKISDILKDKLKLKDEE